MGAECSGPRTTNNPDGVTGGGSPAQAAKTSDSENVNANPSFATNANGGSSSDDIKRRSSVSEQTPTDVSSWWRPAANTPAVSLWERAMRDTSASTRDLVMRAAKRVQAGQMSEEEAGPWMAEHVKKIQLLTDGVLRELWDKCRIRALS